MEFTVEEHGSTVLIGFHGRLMGGPSTDQLMSICKEQLLKGCFDRVVLDFKDLSWLNSSGLGALISLYAAVNEAKKNLVTYRVSRRIADIFVHTKMDTVFKEIEKL